MKCLKCDRLLNTDVRSNYCEEHRPAKRPTISMGSVYINGFWLFVVATLAITTALIYIFNL